MFAATIFTIGWLTAGLSPRVAIVALAEDEQLTASQTSHIEAVLSMRGYSNLDPQEAALLLGHVETGELRDPAASYIEAKLAYNNFDNELAQRRLEQARLALFESPRILSERGLLAETHILTGRLALDEGREADAVDEFVIAQQLDSELSLHPGLFPPPVLVAFETAAQQQKNRPKGALAVDVEPHGANVYVDTNYVGTAPVVVEDLGEGQHYVTVAVQDRGARTRNVVVAGGRSTQIRLFVPDATALSQLGSTLQNFRSTRQAQDGERILDAVGADLMLGIGTTEGLLIQRSQHNFATKTLNTEAYGAAAFDDKALLLLELAVPMTDAISASSQAQQTTQSAGSDNENTLAPWFWVSAGAITSALVVAGSIGAVAYFASQPNQPKDDLVNIVIGGPVL